MHYILRCTSKNYPPPPKKNKKNGVLSFIIPEHSITILYPFILRTCYFSLTCTSIILHPMVSRLIGAWKFARHTRHVQHMVHVVNITLPPTQLGSRVKASVQSTRKMKKLAQSIIERVVGGEFAESQMEGGPYHGTIWNIIRKLSCALSDHLMTSGIPCFARFVTIFQSPGTTLAHYETYETWWKLLLVKWCH